MLKWPCPWWLVVLLLAAVLVDVCGIDQGILFAEILPDTILGAFPARDEDVFLALPATACGQYWLLGYVGPPAHITSLVGLLCGFVALVDCVLICHNALPPGLWPVSFFAVTI